MAVNPHGRAAYDRSSQGLGAKVFGSQQIAMLNYRPAALVVPKTEGQFWIKLQSAPAPSQTRSTSPAPADKLLNWLLRARAVCPAVGPLRARKRSTSYLQGTEDADARVWSKPL